MKRLIVGVLLALIGPAVGAGVGAAQDNPPRPAPPPAAQPAPPGWLGLAFHFERQGSGRSAREVAVVADVHPGSPAARAGLQRGDTIVRVNGRTEVEAQIRALRLQPGDTVRLRLRRAGTRDRDLALVAAPRPTALAARPTDGQRIEVLRRDRNGRPLIIINGDTVRVPVDSLMAQADSLQRHIRVLIADSLAPRLREIERARLPELRERIRALDTALVRAFPEGLVLEVGGRAVAGAEFSELNPALAEYFEGAREGLLVLRVAPGSPAARAGLQPGDVVTRANGEPVRTTAELRRIVARAGRDEVRLGVVRKGRPLELRVR